jgi:hypothetical protein
MQQPGFGRAVALWKAQSRGMERGGLKSGFIAPSAERLACGG